MLIGGYFISIRALAVGIVLALLIAALAYTLLGGGSPSVMSSGQTSSVPHTPILTTPVLKPLTPAQQARALTLRGTVRVAVCKGTLSSRRCTFRAAQSGSVVAEHGKIIKSAQILRGRFIISLKPGIYRLIVKSRGLVHTRVISVRPGVALSPFLLIPSSVP